MPITRVMIVDDDEANTLFFQVVLKDLGEFQVITSPSGEEAIKAARDTDAQLVIVAWELKAMPGTVLVQKLKAARGRKYVPYLIYSKRMSEEDARLAREIGLPDVMTMPFDRTKATETLRTIIARESKVAPEEAKLRKIEGYLDEGKGEVALKLMDGRLQRPGPYFVRGQLALANCWMQLNQLTKAEPVVRKILEKDPDNFDAKNLLAQICSRTSRHDEGLQILETLAKDSSKNITTLLSLGSAYAEADRLDDAKKMLGKAEALGGDSGRLKDEKGKVAFKEGDFSLAAQLLRETENGEQLARHFNNVAVGLVHQQNLDKAIETYNYAVKFLQERAKVHLLRYNLGLALSKKGELAQSFVELVKSYKSEPRFEKAYAALARVAKRMHETGVAYDKTLAKEVNGIRRRLKEAEAAAAAKKEAAGPALVPLKTA